MVRTLTALGLTKTQALRFFISAGGTRRDAVLGLHGNEERVGSLREAQRLVTQQGGERRAFYVDIEVHNLGGLNAAAGSGAAANKHLAAYARLAGHALDGLEAQVLLFRQGGPRFSALVYADASVDQSAIERAMRGAQADIDVYARSEGIAQARHPKEPANAAAGGAGLHFGVAEIRRGSKPRVGLVIKAAEAARAQNAQAQGEQRRRAAEGDAPVADEKTLTRIFAAIEAPSLALGGGIERKRPDEALSKKVSAPPTSVTGVFPDQITLRRAAVMPLGATRPEASVGRWLRALRAAFRASGGENRDPVTRLERGENRVPTVRRLLEYLRAHSKQSAFYVVVDIANVAGLNQAHSKAKVNREVFRRFAELIQGKLRGIEGVRRLSVAGFRHGGDELSFVLVGEGLGAAKVEQAMGQAKREVRVSAAASGFMETPALRQGRPPGTDIYWAMAAINADSRPEWLFEAADRAIERLKVAPAPAGG
ncbi:MAG: hypothetical protein IPL40_11380 [Proteobacteria bacterium]|nr:hypothetical protein [Pseudomonadota bacterium]